MLFKTPGKAKAKTYTFSGKKITNNFTVKVSNVNIADVMALEGQNFNGSRNGVAIVK